MTRLLLILLLPLFLNASKILSYNVYDRTDRVDVMITFDTPYEGKIKQSTSDSKIIIKLEDASIESTKTKALSSKFLNSISIVPLAQYTKIVAEVPAQISFKASKTSDAYGLRLRFTTALSNDNNTQSPIKNSLSNKTSSLPTKPSEDLSNNYYMVIGILLIGILILFILKNKINKSASQNKSSSWLFKVANDAHKGTPEGVSIRFQKNINEHNSVVMLDFLGQSYLVLMGSNNILLDKFTDNKPVTQDDFDTILQNRHQELDDFLQEGTMQEKDPMQIYKEKAANISYTS
ncbi:MAG: hypothetical protein H8E76_05640 [Helicobacteraceae bacterium]|nr:hypothetical protein [Candidatus Sulfurimonas ponti]MBL6973040.1 hypothetical protein [Sulfurimonas sp.]